MTISAPLAVANLSFPAFDPPVWLRNHHVQTLVASRKPRRWNYGWTVSEPFLIDLGKDGKLGAEASWQPGNLKDCPLLFLMHGLEGSAQSHYLVGMSKKAYALGFHTVRVNTRNCGGTEHLTPTLYCAGLSQDVAAVVRHFRERLDIREIYGAAVSLGANILLKYLGEQGDRGPDCLRGAAVLSPPIDLGAGVRKMEEPQNWIYQRYFVGKLIERMRRKTALFPGLGDMGRIARVRTIHEFDDVVTAPHFGFGTADNYYRLASSGPLLRDIRVPTLIIQAQDDPLVPFESFRNSGIEANPCLRLLAPRHGGHTGFLGSRPACGQDQDAYWGECRAVQFLSALAKQSAIYD
jgi:predicted alpha/beta-fold hydrolase